jgi:hypothetical protein
MFVEKLRQPEGSAARVVEQSPVGLDSLYETVAAAFDNSRVVEASNNQSIAMERAYDQRADRIKAAGIKGAEELLNPVRTPPSSVPGEMGEAPQMRDYHAEFNRKLHELHDRETDPVKRAAIGIDRAVEEDAKEISRQAQIRANTAYERAPNMYGLYGAAYYGSSFVGAMTDPVNLASLALGPWRQVGVGAKAVLWNGVKTGAVNAGAEAVVQPFAQAWKKEAGLEYGLKDAASNIAMAFGMGLGLDAGVRGISRGVRNYRGHEPILDKQGLVTGWRKPLTDEQKLEEAARRKSPNSVVRKAAEGDLESIKRLTKEQGLADDPATKGAIQTAEIEEELAGKAPEFVDEIEGPLKVLQAAKAAMDDAEPPPRGADPVPPATPRFERLSDDGPAPPASYKLDGKPVSFREIPAKEIGVDAATFQFKGGGNAQGVTQRLAGVVGWDPIAAGRAIVFERADGTKVIADGHQRLGLAQRLEQTGNEPISMPATVFREADGWTAADVRAMAARKNLQEGSGEVADVARVLRDRPDILDASVPRTTEAMRMAANLARLSDEAFAEVEAGLIKPNHAAVVGELVEAKSQHAPIIRAIAKAEPNNVREVRHIVNDLTQGPRHETQEILLGGHANEALLAERAQVLDHALKLLKDDAKIFAILSKEAERITQAGNVLAENANAARVFQSEAVASMLEVLAVKPGPVREWLDDAARAVAGGTKPKVAAKEFAKDVREQLLKHGFEGLKPEPPPPLVGRGIDDPYGPEAKAQVKELEEAWEQSLKALAIKHADKHLKNWLNWQKNNNRDAPPVDPLVRAEAVKLIAQGEHVPDAIREARKAIQEQQSAKAEARIMAEAERIERETVAPEEVEEFVRGWQFANEVRRLQSEGDPAKIPTPEEIAAAVAVEKELAELGFKGIKDEADLRARLETRNEAVAAGRAEDGGDRPSGAGQDRALDDEPDLFALGGGADSAERFEDEFYAALKASPADQHLEISLSQVNPTTYELVSILNRKSKGGGHGTAAMQMLVDAADRNGITLTLSVAEDADDYARLKNWYRGFGFNTVRGSDMRRRPVAADRFALGPVEEGQMQRRAFDQLGFYSQALEAARSLKQAKGTPEQMLEQLLDAGVREAEVRSTKLDEFLLGKTLHQYFADNAGKPTAVLAPERRAAFQALKEETKSATGARKQELIAEMQRLSQERKAELAEFKKQAGSSQEPVRTVTRDEIVQHLEANRVEVRESRYGGEASYEQWLNNKYGKGKWGDPEYDSDAVHQQFLKETGRARWVEYSLDPSNPTYRETVIHLPSATDSFRRNADNELNSVLSEMDALQTRAENQGGDALRKLFADPAFQALDARRKALDEQRLRGTADGDFKGGHWSEPNVIAHMRTSVQKDAQGRPVFLLDELQSDWGQKLRDGGARDEAKIAELRARAPEVSAKRQALDEETVAFVKANGGAYQGRYADALEGLANRANEQGFEARRLKAAWEEANNQERLLEAELRTAEAATPGHPLVNTTDQWTQTAFRRLIRQAVEAGADYIAITPGKVQNDRFNLARHVQGLRYDPEAQRLDYRKPNGQGDPQWYNAGSVAPADLPNHVGKEMAEKLMQQPRDGSWHTLDDLGSFEMGGSGMRATYDSIYPRTLGKLLGKMDPEAGKMADGPLASSMDGRTFTHKVDEAGQDVRDRENIALAELEDRIEEAQEAGNVALVAQLREEVARQDAALDKDRNILFHTFPLTEKVKAKVMEEGQALFARAGEGGARVGDADLVSRTKAGQAIAAGRTYDIPPAVVDQGIVAIRPVAEMLPDDWQIGLSSKIEPIGDGWVRVSFTRPDGLVFQVERLWDQVRGSRGLTIPSQKTVILFRFDAVPAFGHSVGGEGLHEFTHVIYAAQIDGRLSGASRRLLDGHAEKLRIMDMERNDFFAKIGRRDLVNPAKRGQTLRELYEDLYSKSRRKNELIAEEGTAHMVELIHHGAIRAADVMPVLPILERAFGEAITRRLQAPGPSVKFLQAGPKARTADLVQLQAAQAMEAAKRSASEIFETTRWYRDNNDNWVFDIPKKDVQLKAQAKGAAQGAIDRPFIMGDAKVHVSAPMTFDAYPELKDIRLNLQRRKGKEGASGADMDVGSIDVAAGSAKAMRQGVIDQMQRFIDEIEGRPSGGEPKAMAALREATNGIDREAADINEQLAAIQAGTVAATDAEAKALRKQLFDLGVLRRDMQTSGWAASLKMVEKRAASKEPRYAVSGEDDWQDALFDEMSRKAAAEEIATGRKPKVKVEPKEPENLIIKMVLDHEQKLWAEGKTADEVAAGLIERFPAFARVIDPVAIAKREAWWHIDRLMSETPKRGAAWTPVVREEFKRLWNSGAEREAIASRLSEIAGTKITLGMISKQRQAMGLTARGGRADAANWTPELRAELEKLLAGGAPLRMIADGLSDMAGRKITIDMVRKERVRLGMERKEFRHWSPAALATLTREDLADLTPMEMSRLLRDEGHDVTYEMVGRQRKRIEEDRAALTGEPPPIPARKYKFRREETAGGDSFARYETEVGPHRLSVEFAREGTGYDLEFMVDGSLNKVGADKRLAVPMFQAIRQKVDEFIAERAPNSLRFEPVGADPARATVWRQFAEQVAKRWGGEFLDRSRKSGLPHFEIVLPEREGGDIKHQIAEAKAAAAEEPRFASAGFERPAASDLTTATDDAAQTANISELVRACKA